MSRNRGKQSDEQRRQPRTPVRVLVEYDSVEEFLIDYTSNISIGGLFIQTQDPLEVGTLFRIRFRIPGDPEPVETDAEVCWILRPEDAGALQPGMGVRFASLKEEDRARVEDLLKDW